MFFKSVQRKKWKEKKGKEIPAYGKSSNCMKNSICGKGNILLSPMMASFEFLITRIAFPALLVFTFMY